MIGSEGGGAGAASAGGPMSITKLLLEGLQEGCVCDCYRGIACRSSGDDGGRVDVQRVAVTE